MPEIPDLIPARMLNEFTYCPRLFYLEWVDDRWADSADTEAGRYVHRVVDSHRDSVPDPDGEDLARRVMSARVESTRLGVVSVIDRIDGDFGSLIPVDFKKGHPAPDGGPWPADRIQVITQAAVLRDAGHVVTRAMLYYAETRQRVFVEVDSGTDREVEAVVLEARAVAASPRPPLPLLHSAKCPRCSLVGLCLPDETNALLARDDAPPRTIVPRDPDDRPLYVNEQGAYVGVRGARIRVVKGEQELASVRMIDVSQLCLYGNVQVSAQALAGLWDRGVPVLWFSTGGWLRGWAQGEMSKYVELRRRQVAVHAQGGFDIARVMIAGKIRNSRTILRRNARSSVDAEFDQLARLAVRAEGAENAQSLLGIEGAAARTYFSAFTSMLSDQALPFVRAFDANGRKRRPAPDPVNALLGYTYSLLLKDIVATCIGVGLDPYLGFFHRPRYGRPSLALDLMEEFRPIISESVVIGMINNGEARESDFVARGSAVWLTPNGRKKVLQAYERRMDTQVMHPTFKYKATYRRVLDIQARIVAANIIGELDRYTAMVTR